jgi:thioredoxin 1
MKTSTKLLFLALFGLFMNACQMQAKSEDQNQVLTAKAFAEAIKSANNIIDVRTPSEFESGHINGAVNIDWNADGFEKSMAQYQKEAPIYVYCLSGGRSGQAAQFLRQSGYTKVYELEGGMMAWRSNQLPEVNGNSAPVADKISAQAYQTMIDSNQLILVDFYAVWCAPCQKMKPYLETLSQKVKGTVKVERINVEENKTLCQTLKVSALPVLKLYKKGVIVWEANSLVTEAELIKQIELHQ